jgi:hypothetical protein
LPRPLQRGQSFVSSLPVIADQNYPPSTANTRFRQAWPARATVEIGPGARTLEAHQVRGRRRRSHDPDEEQLPARGDAARRAAEDLPRPPAHGSSFSTRPSSPSTRRRVRLRDEDGNADQSFAPITLDVEQVTVRRG